MELRDRVVVVTGAARGIGLALCRRSVAEGASGVVLSDRDGSAAQEAASELARESGSDVIAVSCDVGQERQIAELVSTVQSRYGRIDVFFSNAGMTVKGGLECGNSDWQRMWEVNVMSRLYAARAVIPLMLEQGGGYLIHTASAAGLLTEIGSASYSVTKHADLALAEWLSVCYGRSGIRVSCVCPLGVETDMLDQSDPIHRYLNLHAISAEAAAEAIMRGVRDERFLILPHPEVAEFWRLKHDDYDRWLRGMQRLRQKLTRFDA